MIFTKRFLTIVLVLFVVEPINGTLLSTQDLSLARCRQPLILFSEYGPKDREATFCLGFTGPIDLGIKGSSPRLSPAQDILAYSRTHGPNRTYGKELFGYTSLYLYDFRTHNETTLLRDYGNILYYWARPLNQLLISAWKDRLGSYENDYPIHFLYDPSSHQLVQQDWPNGRVVGYLPWNRRFLLFDYPRVFSVSTDGKRDVQPVTFPHEPFTWGMVMSQGGEQIAYPYTCERAENAWLECIEVYEPQSGISIKIGESSVPASVNLMWPEMSKDGRYLAFLINDGQHLGIYDVAKRQFIFVENMDESIGRSLYRWMDDADVLLILHVSSEKSYADNLFSFDTQSLQLTQLTNTPSSKGF